MKNNSKEPQPHLLAIVVDRNRHERLAGVLREMGLPMHFSYICMAEGTASSDIMDMLGLGSIDKALVLCLTPESNLSFLLQSLNEKLSLHKAKRGIAFTLPLSGLNQSFLQFLNKKQQKSDVISNEPSDATRIGAKNGAETRITMEISHELIVAVINQGYSDDLMVAAKKAGAKGGTVFHARRIGTEEAASFFGITVQAEKEIVTVLTNRENKDEIMQAIQQSSGIQSKAKGIVFSLPVDGVAGLG